VKREGATAKTERGSDGGRERGRSLFKTAAEGKGGPVKRRHKAASKAAQNSSLFIRTHS
jgi:hypothetical protein